MSPRLLTLKTAVIACLSLGLMSIAGTHAVAAEKMAVSRTAPAESNDPLHVWIKEQDKILDEILLRLGRVEKLVQDLHRLVGQMPGPQPAGTSPVVTPPAATPAVAPPAKLTPTTAPVASPAAPEPSPAIEDWLPPVAGGLVLVLLLGWLWRRRRPVTVAQEPLPAITNTKPSKAEAPPKPELESIDLTDVPVVTSAKPAPAAPAPAKSSAPDNSAPLYLTQNDEALELAEIMLSMGLGHGAAQTLVEKIEREPKQALLHWLKLLAIYRQSGQQAEFEQSAEELRKHFNVQPEDWHALPGVQRSLEDYPHIAARMIELWGKPSCHAYLTNLLDDNREGARAGFPQSVAEELVLLTAILREQGLAS